MILNEYKIQTFKNSFFFINKIKLNFGHKIRLLKLMRNKKKTQINFLSTDAKNC